jgi:putative acetyltransferase
MIRRATREDIPICAGIIADWEADTDYLPTGPGRDEIAQMIDAAFDKREIWVSGDPVDSYMSVDPDQAKIGGLYLLRQFLWLTVFAPNTRAFAFYRREGFSLTSNLPVGGDAPAVLRMEWHR